MCGVASLVLVVIGYRIFNGSPPEWVFLGVAGICVPIALARAWYVQFLAREAAEARAGATTERADRRFTQLIQKGLALRAESPTMSQLWLDNVEQWRMSADQLVEKESPEDLQRFRTLSGIDTTKLHEITVTRHWLTHGIGVLTRLRDFEKPWALRPIRLDKAARLNGDQLDEVSVGVIAKLRSLRTWRSRAFGFCVDDEDRQLCEGILAYLDHSGWKIAIEAKPEPHKPTWDAPMGVFVEGRKAREIAEALSCVFGGVQVGKSNTDDHSARVYVIRPPFPLSEC